MKKIIIISVIFFFINCEKCFASWGYKYVDGGGIYTGVTFPVTACDVNRKKDIDLTNLKRGESVSRNILHLVDIGDSGINQAAKNGRINKISYIDVNELNILFFFRKLTVTVYGE